MLSWLGFSILIIIYVLQQGMVIVHNNFTSNCNYWAMFFESMVMAFALAWRFKFYKEDSERLLKENQLQQENIFSEIALYQEKEMQRMSSMLHDSIGADLGLLRLEMDNLNLTEVGRQQIANHITRIANEVRTMSHSFSPTLLTEKGLHAAITENIQFISANSSIKLQFEWIGKIDKTSFQNEVIIYRIVQEILQNLLKHSKAKNAIIQILAQENQVSIYAEDDGIGISSLSQTKGIGLKSIEKLVSLLKGHFKIDSTENTGFSISVEFNLMNNGKI
jgi:signal transduction histidine kinase